MRQNINKTRSFGLKVERIESTKNTKRFIFKTFLVPKRKVETETLPTPWKPKFSPPLTLWHSSWECASKSTRWVKTNCIHSGDRWPASYSRNTTTIGTRTIREKVREIEKHLFREKTPTTHFLKPRWLTLKILRSTKLFLRLIKSNDGRFI